jgi:FlaA1/EpsC-like NDP-sugar epimerase
MTIPEACQLILQAGALSSDNNVDVFILDMGTPVKIADMARDLIRLSGFKPDMDILVEFTGLRPGEKLFEELIPEGEGIVSTSHEKIMTLQGDVCRLEILNGNIDELSLLADKQEGRLSKQN